MSRLIKLDSGLRERNKLLKIIAICLNHLMKETEIRQDFNEDNKDLIACIVLSLEEINHNIQSSVAAWEKRGYWLKAERYLSEWQWVDTYAKKLREAILHNDWQALRSHLVFLAQKLSNVKCPSTNRMGTPWKGAWEKL